MVQNRDSTSLRFPFAYLANKRRKVATTPAYITYSTPHSRATIPPVLAMAESAPARDFTVRDPRQPNLPKHSAIVRVTHGITLISFLGLLVSGIAILLAHPRFYWGETGAVGAPSLFDVPLPFILAHSGWGRYLHFLSAWVCALTGLLYVLYGFLGSHFRKAFVPTKTDLSLRSIAIVISNHFRLKRSNEVEYNVLQKFSYLTVVFVLFPVIIVTGLAMSPTITSVIPSLSGVFGGRQSARTVHFFLAASLVLFLLVHIAMVSLAGFTTRVRAMITGYHTKRG